MAAEKENWNEKESPRQPTTWLGRFNLGKWYCDCDRRARCFTVTKSSPNKGKKFWTCPKNKDYQCPFFVWVEQEAEAIEWLEKSKPQSILETPTRKGLKSDDSCTPATGLSDLSKSQETPFTNSKRKQVYREASSEHENHGLGNQNLDGGESYMQDNAAMDGTLRKATKVTRFSTPSQIFNKKLKAACSVSGPTPESGGKRVGDMTASEQRLQSIEISPALARANNTINLGGERKSDLTMTVLSLIRSDSLELTESTKSKIGIAIRLELDSNKARERTYEETISELHERLDELETTDGHLTAGGAVNRIMELSDERQRGSTETLLGSMSK